jgi:AraC family transcriptional regulator
MQAWFDGEPKWTDAQLRASLDIASPNIRHCLFRLGEELRSPGFASAAFVEMMAGQVCIELARYCAGSEVVNTPSGLCAWRLRLIDDRLAEPGAPASLSELAALCRLSVRHLTRGFRISRCRSIGSYLAECRMNEAKRLLATGMPVKQVAHSMGFASPSNFTTAFRHATGTTPREYQQREDRAAARH